MQTTLPASTVRYWSEAMADHAFDSEREARNTVFRLCENYSRQSWSVPEGKNTSPGNRKFAAAMPMYQEKGRWKVGRPLNEYLSANTSDFSDGTNGEPSGYPPSGGSAGSAVGLPDYKYLERKKRRHDKLRALMQRRDPERVSTNLWDRNVRALMGETEDGPILAYHASPEKFDVFDTSREGAHFGTYEQASNLRKSGKHRPKPYLLDIKNPLRMHDIGVWNNFNNLHGALSVGNFISDQQADAVWAAWQRSDAEGWQTLKRAVEENGYDGIVYRNEQEGEGDSYIAFRPEQIKPAPPGLAEQRLSREEMAILKKQTRRRRLRVREDEEIDPKDVQFEPLPDYEQHTEEKFGWALNLGSQQEIEQRAEIAGIRLTSKTWDLINVQYYDVERNVVFYLVAEGGLTLRGEGHSDEDLVGSGWILPAQRPKLWHLLSNVPERTYINLLDTGYFTGLTPDRIFGEASKIMHKLLVPMFYVFDMQPVIPE